MRITTSCRAEAVLVGAPLDGICTIGLSENFEDAPEMAGTPMYSYDHYTLEGVRWHEGLREEITASFNAWIRQGKEAEALQIDGERAERARAERDRLLNVCDTIHCNASNWERMAPEKKEAWQVYKQALRDVPEQAGFPSEIYWPTMPGEETAP